MTTISTRRITANGLTFAIDEAGEGDTVALLLHGFPESRAACRRQLPHLARLGWRAIAPDLRGYGETSRPGAKAEYRIEHLIDDVAALFDAVGARRRVLIGHDWGGVIAWQTALRRRAALDGLVVVNAPHPAVFARVLRRGFHQARRSWYILMFLLPWLPELQLIRNGGRGLVDILRRQSPHFPPDLLELYRRNVTQPGAATAMLNYYRANAAIFATSGENWGQSRFCCCARSWTRGATAKSTLTPILTPTLMIWGEDDQALELALTEGNEEFVEDFTLRRLPHVSHWVMQDAPDRVNELIETWARQKGLTGAAA